MQKYKTLFFIFTIALTVLSLVPLFDHPLEGGLILGLLAWIWIGISVNRYSEFRISKNLIIASFFCFFLFWLKEFSYPTPANIFTIFTSLLFLLFAFLIYVTLSKESERLIWENSLIIAGLVVAILELIETVFFYYQYFSTKPLLMILHDLRITFRLSGLLFVHPNVLAGFLNFVWPMIVIRLTSTARRREQLLWCIALVLFGVIFFYTISRGGTLGAILAGMLLLYILIKPEIVQKTTSKRVNARSHPYILPLGILSLLAVSFIVGIIWRAINSGQISPAALSATRFLTILDGLSSGRGYLWKYAWKAFLEKPIIGHGNAGFPIAYLKSAQLPPGFLAPSAHNLGLNVAVEYGYIGLVFLVILLIYFIWRTLHYLHERGGNSLIFSDAYLTSFVAFLIHQIFDAMLWVPSYLAALIVVLVLLTRYTLPFREWRLDRKLFLGLSSALILVLSFSYILLANIVAPSYLYHSSSVVPQTMSLSHNICKLADRYRGNALYSFECSMELLQQLSITFPEVVDPVKANLSLQYQERGFSLNPYWPPQQANLSVLAWLNEQQSYALEQMRQAASNAPKNPLIWVNLGWMEEQSGNLSQAFDAYDRALRLNPLMLNSYFFRSSTFFSILSDHLEKWRFSEEKWDDWYQYEIVDKAFQRGIIAMSLGDLDAALIDFQTSAEHYKSLTPYYYACLAYAQYLDGQAESAYRIAYDLALLDQKNLVKIEEPILVSYLGFILFENEQKDLAYHLYMNSYHLQTRPSDFTYYTLVYRQPIIQTDLSPLLIRNLYVIEESRPGWEWFIDQVFSRETTVDAEQIARWYKQLAGIALLKK